MAFQLVFVEIAWPLEFIDLSNLISVFTFVDLSALPFACMFEKVGHLFIVLVVLCVFTVSCYGCSDAWSPQDFYTGMKWGFYGASY